MNDQDFDDLVQFEGLSGEEGSYQMRVKLNKGHRVFVGHFPGQPILPGVIMVEMLRRAMQLITKKKLALKKASNIKFLNIIDPTKIDELDLEIGVSTDDQLMKAKGRLFKGDDVFLKVQASFYEA